MTITTAIIITVAGLAIYYIAMIAYDLYLDKLAKANNDEVKETAIDISDEANGFRSIPVEDGKHSEDIQKKFEDMVGMGITAEKTNRLMTSAVDGTNSAVLDNILHTIRQNN